MGPREELVRRFAASGSFVDVGAIWGIHGSIAFLAEELGARPVTAVDIMGPTPQYRTAHRARASAVRFVQGDVHEPETLEAIGTHDVVWCAGLLYHAPNPQHTLACLRQVTGRVLLMESATIPEVPGVEQACVFYPGLSEGSRREQHRAQAAAGGVEALVGLSTPFEPARGYENYWWGLSPSAVRGLLISAGFNPVEIKTNGFQTRVVALPCPQGDPAVDFAPR